MDTQEDFDYVFSIMKTCDEFVNYCRKKDIEEEQQKYLVVWGMNHNLNETQRCNLTGIKYNFRPHQRYKSDHDEGVYDQMIFLTVKTLAELKQDKKSKEKLSDFERLDLIINGDHRVTDQLKAMELKDKLTKMQQGSHILKPWERIWNDLIIPNMLQANDLQ